MEPDEHPGVLHEEVSLLFYFGLNNTLYSSVLTGVCGGAEEEEEEDLTRWLLAYCLGKSGSREEHSHMCAYVRVCVQSCSSVVCFEGSSESPCSGEG